MTQNGSLELGTREGPQWQPVSSPFEGQQRCLTFLTREYLSAWVLGLFPGLPCKSSGPSSGVRPLVSREGWDPGLPSSAAHSLALLSGNFSSSKPLSPRTTRLIISVLKTRKLIVQGDAGAAGGWARTSLGCGCLQSTCSFVPSPPVQLRANFASATGNPTCSWAPVGSLRCRWVPTVAVKCHSWDSPAPLRAQLGM